MAQRTSAEETMTREELATYLAEIAGEFERGEEEIGVGVGNKSITLHPPENVDVSVDVVERSSMIRGQRETIEIELQWKP